MTSESSPRAPLETLVAKFAHSWNEHDMTAFGDLFSEDADFVNVAGMWWHGRDEIVAMHARAHAGMFANSCLTIEDVTVRFLNAESALVRARWSMTGHAQLSEKWDARRHGILLLVAARREDLWHFVDAQNTDADPGLARGALS